VGIDEESSYGPREEQTKPYEHIENKIHDEDLK